MAEPAPIAASVIVPSYRGADRLPALLSALAAQQAPGAGAGIEVLVVIDGLVDGSEDVVRAAAATAPAHLHLRALVLPENRGRVGALNAGHAAARGAVLIRCDDDLLPAPDFVVRHLAAHREGEVPAVIGPTRDLLADTPYARVYGEQAAARSRAAVLAAPPATRWRHWAANCSLTREAHARIGPYDPGYRGYGWEDVDYGYRLHAAGLAIALDPALETGHRAAAVTTAIRARRAQDAGAARHRFETLHPEAGLPSAIPAPSPWNLAVRAVSRLPGRPPAGARAVDLLLRLLPRPVGRKLVALWVEGAGVAGYRRARARTGRS